MKKYNLYKFVGKIEGLTPIGDWELVQELSGDGLRVKSLTGIKKWIDLAKGNETKDF